MIEDFQLCDGCTNELVCSDTHRCTKALAPGSGSRAKVYQVEIGGVCLRVPDQETLQILMEALEMCQKFDGFEYDDAGARAKWIKAAFSKMEVIELPENEQS